MKRETIRDIVTIVACAVVIAGAVLLAKANV